MSYIGIGQRVFLNENAIKESYVIVAEINNQVVGYLLGEENNIPYYNFRIAELCNMCIDSNYRKRGIGNALYKEFETFYNKSVEY